MNTKPLLALAALVTLSSPALAHRFWILPSSTVLSGEEPWVTFDAAVSNNLFFDSCGYDLDFLQAAIKQRGVDRMVFGTEAPGSGGAIRPETGRTSDDLVPVLDSFEFLTDADRRAIFHDNPLKVVPGFARSGRLDPTATTAQPAGV